MKVGDIVKRKWNTGAERRRAIQQGRCASEHGVVLEMHLEVDHVKLLCAGVVLETRMCWWEVMGESA